MGHWVQLFICDKCQSLMQTGMPTWKGEWRCGNLECQEPIPSENIIKLTYEMIRGEQLEELINKIVFKIDECLLGFGAVGMNYDRTNYKVALKHIRKEIKKSIKGIFRDSI